MMYRSTIALVAAPAAVFLTGCSKDEGPNGAVTTQKAPQVEDKKKDAAAGKSVKSVKKSQGSSPARAKTENKVEPEKKVQPQAKDAWKQVGPSVEDAQAAEFDAIKKRLEAEGANPVKSVKSAKKSQGSSPARTKTEKKAKEAEGAKKWRANSKPEKSWEDAQAAEFVAIKKRLEVEDYWKALEPEQPWGDVPKKESNVLPALGRSRSEEHPIKRHVSDVTIPQRAASHGDATKELSDSKAWISYARADEMKAELEATKADAARIAKELEQRQAEEEVEQWWNDVVDADPAKAWNDAFGMDVETVEVAKARIKKNVDQAIAKRDQKEREEKLAVAKSKARAEIRAKVPKTKRELAAEKYKQQMQAKRQQRSKKHGAQQKNNRRQRRSHMGANRRGHH